MFQFRVLSFRLFLLVPCFCLVSGVFVSCNGSEPDQNDSDPYISEVFEYVYAPGQHAKEAAVSDTADFIGKPTDGAWLYLGGFGGYVIAGFNHNVMNGTGNDFEVYALKGSSPEPAVVYVMSDTNSDGKPNDTWYELKGNQFDNSKRNYWVRYYRAVSDTANITWLDSEGSKGYLKCGYGAPNSSGWWWPTTITDSITLHGTRLPDSYENTGTNGGEFWTVPTSRFISGYAENISGTDYDKTVDANKLDIANAVDAAGQHKELSNIRFIKIQTGVFQQAGWTNEVSSEVRGAKDLRK